MAKLVLDTSAWLDLAKLRFSEVLTELEEQIASGGTVLLVSQIIKDEWARNKERVINDTMQSIRSHARSALTMAELLEKQDSDQLTAIAEKYRTIEAAQRVLAEKFAERLEKLIDSATVYPIKDELKIEMADRAVAKLAPFHNSKNNMADALLYFGAVAYVREHTEIANDLIFVTSNSKEFNDPDHPLEIHPDLKRPFVHFNNNVANALQMRKEVIDEMDEYHEYKFWSWIEQEADIARGK